MKKAQAKMDGEIPMAYATPLPDGVAVLSPPPAPNGNESSFRLSSMQEKEIDDNQIEQLRDQGFTTGLAKALSTNIAVFPLRIWIVDNSGSMTNCDGHRLVETIKKDDVKIVSCTRWAEIQETVEYHAQIAGLLRAPTIFRMLNNPGARAGSQQFSIAEKGDDMIGQDIRQARDTMRRSTPGGTTPLAKHVREIQQSVREMQPSLTREGKKVAIILATDGLPTDERGMGGDFEKREFIDAMKQLEGLPVWIVVRLCTDDEKVVDFYNELDSQLELSLEVLDDFVGEAHEVYEHNKWLNYTLPLHRCREMGYHNRLLDLLDERKLTKGELRDFSLLLFGEEAFDGVPDPEVDWNGFLGDVSRMLSMEKKQYDPLKKKMMPWIDMNALNNEYGDQSCCILI